jgi:hypothetical protein
MLEWNSTVSKSARCNNGWLTDSNTKYNVMTKASTLAPTITGLERKVGSADWSRWTQNRWMFYDYVRLNPAGTDSINFFNQPLGSNDPVSNTAKSLEQTNLTEVRSFGRVNYIIKSIRTHIRIAPKSRQPAGISGDADFLASGAANPLAYAMEQLAHQGTLLVTLGQKEYMDIPQPFIACPPAAGLEIDQIPANGVAIMTSWFQQSNCSGGLYMVKPEQLIEAGQTIQCNIAFENGNTPVLTNLIGGATTPVVEIGLILDGYILRPVQ